MHALIFILISACFLGKATRIAAQTCYFPDGSQSSRDTPCRTPSPGQASACCAYFDICLDNSLCLAQSGNEVVSRGTCTDQSWQSSDCPRYCQDVHTYGVTIYPFQDDKSFCCGPGNSSTNLCVNSALGNATPFAVEAGRVIFNRTSGSTSANDSETATVTVSFTATPSTSTSTPPLTDPTIFRDSPCSSNKSAAVGLGVGVPLGLALAGALGLLWRQRSRELGARREARAWQEKYDEIKEKAYGGLIVHEGQIQELGWDSWKPDELDGRLVHEMQGS